MEINKDLKPEDFLRKLKHHGKDLKIFDKAQLIKPELISIGDYSQIDDFVWILAGQGVEIGRRVHISAFSSIAGGGKCSIEDYASLAIGSRIITGSDDFSGNALINPCIPAEYRKVTRSSVKIGKFAALGTNVVVMPGVNIGEGVLVLAGSIVTKNLDPWGVYIGAPVNRIRNRDANTILKMAQDLEKKYG